MTPTTFAIRGGTALIGETLEVVAPSALMIAGGEIIAAGPEGEVDVPDGVVSFDATGMTLTPGFIDAHVHIGFYPPRAILGGGVTTVRDLGWPAEDIHPLVAGSAAPTFDGPEIIASGPILTAPGGYPTRAGWAPRGTGREVATPADAQPAVERTIEEGAAVIKLALEPSVGPTFDLATLTAIVRAAHERERRVTGHVSGIEELEKALDAGMDELAHMLMSDERIPDQLIARMVAQGMTVVPTLSCRFGSDRATAIQNLARFRAAGGDVVYGTDLGNEGPVPGIDPSEVRAMSEAGYSVHDIIRSATVDAAAWLGLHDRGSLSVGKRADVVAFTGALDDASDLGRLTTVWRSGVPRRSGKLDG